MFILKFTKYFGCASDTVTSGLVDVVSADRYQVYTRTNGIKTVTTYKDRIGAEGVEFHIPPDGDISEGRYHICYVENSNGQTVEVIRPVSN